MNDSIVSASSTRRDFFKKVGGASAASALAGVSIPHVFGQESQTVQLALVGCGGRGGGAAAQALSVTGLPTKMVAMADVFRNNLDLRAEGLKNKFEDTPGKFAVPEDQKFIGFDGYKHAMDCLRPGDIVILTTPLAFRVPHFEYAISKGLNVFMEKPLTADGPSSKKMLELAKKADEKGLKVGVGLMVRHCRGRQELYQRIQDGQIGDIIAMRAYRMDGPTASAFSVRKPEGQSEVLFQIERFHSFLWASGGCFNDFYIHQVDECSWMKNAWPEKAQALGGRHYRTDRNTGQEYIDQNFDTYAVEYTYPDGTKLFYDGRTMIGCHNEMSSTAHGSKGSAVISTAGHTPGKVRIFKGQIQSRRREDVAWAYPQPEADPYQLEWDDLVDAIKNNTPYNEVKRGVEASLAASMGRMAAHTGQEITFEQMLNCEHEFAPDVANMTVDGPAPVMPDENGRYPIPKPGINKTREYEA